MSRTAADAAISALGNDIIAGRTSTGRPDVDAELAWIITAARQLTTSELD